VQYIKTIIDHHEKQGLDLHVAVQLALIGRYYERIGDHAVNVGERICYMVTGLVADSPSVAGADST
jgi:phosphate transport system protein